MQPTNTYSFTSGGFEGEIIFGYDKDGLLVQYECKADVRQDALTYLLINAFPVHEERLKHIVAISKHGASIKLLPPDLTFERFWAEYDKKTDKETTMKRWKALPEGEKLAALNYIPVYNSSLIKSGLAKLYPSTYLSKKRWNDNK